MLDDRPYMRRSSFETRWSQTVVLIVALVGVYVIQRIELLQHSQSGRVGLDSLALTPEFHRGAWMSSIARWCWQVFSFQFLHGSPMHLFLNCLSLYFVGPSVEQALGSRRFWKLFIFSGAGGGLLQVLLVNLFSNHFSGGIVVGASGGLFGLIAAFSVLHWNQTITMLVAFLIPLSIRAKYLLALGLVIAGIGMLDRNTEVAHAAHLGGLIVGFFYAKWLGGARPSWLAWHRFRSPSRTRELVRTRVSTVEGWKKAAPTHSEDLPPAEFISREVDPILDKISAHGIHSLTDRERRILEAARAKMSKR